jgi:hypothetical protein
LIRNWFESRANDLWSRVTKVTDKSVLASEIEERWIEVLYLIGMVLLTAGLVCAAIDPVDIGYVIFPSSGAQSATETGVDALALLIGSIGIYLSYLSGRQTTKSRMVNFFLTIGLLMIAIAVYIGIYVLSSK